jgi:hypothetical protein
MNIDEAFAAIGTLIQSSTGSVVQVARPAGDVTGLVIWPWRVVDVSSFRNIPPTHRTTGLVSPPQPVVEVSFLLLASPAGSEGSASQVLQAHRVLLENPVLGGSGSNVRVVAQQLSVDELAAVFTAAHLELSLCTNYSLHLAL